jgi:hypothetical protein
MTHPRVMVPSDVAARAVHVSRELLTRDTLAANINTGNRMARVFEGQFSGAIRPRTP